ncbi:Aste57867_23574 [Aphanomyces stellatus]|uniref:Aste57867_23574 protein n=1 Tax=Aphanomyces stellatus TaxID=120398 RepID=A0A485LP40_9STRA|nr:hypothetical protein As57867_023503 [Aphanomyces stellatus]VFU00219.1 Aste57867_23574 [Aphanomyces stellatus]
MARQWWLVASMVAYASGVDFAQTLIQQTRCSLTPTTPACLEYERCKTTHRCARGDEEYTIQDALLQVYDQAFLEGHRVQVQLVNDFEDWKTGVHHWAVGNTWRPPQAFGFDTFQYPLLGSIELDAGTIYVDTTTATLSGDISFQGVLLPTTQRTFVAVFNFVTFYLGANVQVFLKGSHGLVLLSRSSLVLNTKLIAPPGMLGGFPGGGTLAQYNMNGPGSSNVRVYVHTVTTSGFLQPTIQEIQTSVASGQTLRGYFTLASPIAVTGRIPFDASSDQLKAMLEVGLGIGTVNVQRMGQDVANVGRIWRVTFLTALGNVPLLTPTTYLTGLQSTVQTRIIAAGNQLSGTFRLAFLNKLTPPLSFNISASDLQGQLQAAYDVMSVNVSKLTLTSIERGCTWNIQMTTRIGNTSPTSPTAPVMIQPLMFMTASIADTVVDPVTQLATSVPKLLGSGAAVTITNTAGFSVAYGGAGGTLQRQEDLLGGSGGAGGDPTPTNFQQYPRPILGGAGGGAMYLGAINDVTIGPNASIVVDGQKGEDGIFAGGGGSGGTIVVTSGTSVHILGLLSAQGGIGGASTRAPGGSGSGGWISLRAHSVALSGSGRLQATPQGTVDMNVQTQLQITTDPYVGAAQTSKSLYLAKSIIEQNPILEGPTFSIYAAQPTRVSYFLRLGNVQQGTLLNNRGALFGIHRSSDPTLFVAGIGMLNGAFNYGTNFRGFPLNELVPHVHAFQWYQFDILLNWQTMKLAIRVNGVTLVSNVPFQTDAIDLVGLYTYDAMQTWWDEIHVGLDHTLNFQCPQVQGENVVLQSNRARPLWNSNVVGPVTKFAPKISHESHLSKRPVYQYNHGGLVPNDGPSHRTYFNDIADPTVYDPTNDQGQIAQGEFLQVSISPDVSMVLPLENNVEGVSTQETTMPSETQFWYSEIQVLDSQNNVIGGGIGACSTTDFVTWRNEGIMLHYTNLTDPFGVNVNQSMLAMRPKVIFNPTTGQFVMWMHVDNPLNQMGLSGVAIAKYPNGPFRFMTSFYPSAAVEGPGGQPINETHDQTVAVTANQEAFLIQSYYKTVEYWLPRPIMDPLWESVKKPDGSTDFSLNYHRAFFTKDYDNVDDIYLQRFRSEDVPWSITCCDRATNICDPTVVINNEGCPAQYKKQVIGQAQFNQTVLSRYKDPHDINKNYFTPNSVPSHTDWGFQVYNVKTWRGNYFDALSTNITLLMFKIFAGMSSTYDIPPTLDVPYPPASEQATIINTTNPSNIVEFMLDTMGIPMSPTFMRNFDSYDLAHMDSNGDGKLTLDEIATLTTSGMQTLSIESYNEFFIALEALKHEEYRKMDPNQDGQITYTEFSAWVGQDPALVFDRFDMDKSGYLDENELSRLLIDRQLPRLDSIAILLDPDFDGRVYYEMFEQFIFNASTVTFLNYDFDKSGDLNTTEISILESDIGAYFLNPTVFQNLNNTNTSSIHFDTYSQWMTSSASELRDRVQSFKVDNALHPTRPDRMTGPLYVVEQRRAKYLSIAKLTPDFLSTQQLMLEMEGDFDGEGSLLDIAAFTLQLQFPPVTPAIVPFRQYLAPIDIGHYATYWNGREWEPRPSAPAHFTYGSECINQLKNPNCLPCLSQSKYQSPTVMQYQNVLPTLHFCDDDKALDAYLKQFDQEVSITLRFQELAQFTSAGAQPQYSPCVNQTESVPCDVLKVYEGTKTTPWNLAWETRPVNSGTSVKIRAGPIQTTVIGQTFFERFPGRIPEPSYAMCVINSTVLPDEYQNVLGGG